MKNKTTDIDDIFASAKPKKALATPGASKSTTSTAAPIQSKTSVSASKSGADVKSKATVSKSGLPKADATYQEPAQTLSDSLYTDLRGTKNRKMTEEGYRVYNDEELRIDPMAGNTDDCPFDCSCCY